MSPNALLMCDDQQSLLMMAAALDELQIESELCATAHMGMERLVQEYYSAAIVDFDLPGAAQAARLARLAPPQHRPVVFALIGAMTSVAEAYQAGANFVFYKPLCWEQLMRSLRAGHGFMRQDRRRARRHAASTIVYLTFGGSTLPAMMLNLNQDGMSVQAPEPLPALPEVSLRFTLPGSTSVVEGTGEVVWADDTGRGGFFFTRITATSRKHLKQWLAKRERKTRSAYPAPHFDRGAATVIATD